MKMRKQLNGNVLSIQSHVVHGYVGNKAAVLPLQLNNYNVDVINSVQFSNHTQYPHVKGQRLNDQNLLDLFQGLTLNHFTSHYTHLLTGYIGDSSFMDGIVHVVDELKKLNPNCLYLCDPVLGDVLVGMNNQMDESKLYVPQELIEKYRTQLIPRADIITPNHFEASLLTGTPLDQIQSVDPVVLLNQLHALGPSIVILTSIPDQNNKDQLILYASHKKNKEQQQQQVFKISFPKIESQFTGTGDLVASLILANMKPNVPLNQVVERALASVQFVLEETASQGGGELRLIECWEGIANPPEIQHFAQSIIITTQEE